MNESPLLEVAGELARGAGIGRVADCPDVGRRAEAGVPEDRSLVDAGGWMELRFSLAGGNMDDLLISLLFSLFSLSSPCLCVEG